LQVNVFQSCPFFQAPFGRLIKVLGFFDKAARQGMIARVLVLQQQDFQPAIVKTKDDGVNSDAGKKLLFERRGGPLFSRIGFAHRQLK
jgi:hypothetical protein